MTDATPPDADFGPLDRIRTAGGDALVRRLVDMLLETAPVRLAAAHASLANGDRASVMLTVHSLKSSCAQLGAMAASALCARAEQALTDGDEPLVAGSISAALDSLGRYRDEVERR